MRIGVIGSINVDQVVCVKRIPHKGETIIGDSVEYKHGGKGANQAVALSKLGADTIMFGKVGDDDNGQSSINNLKNYGVDVSCIEVEKNINTGLAVITVGENDNTIIVIAGANSKVDTLYIDKNIGKIKECDIVVLQHEIPATTNDYVINICNQNNIKVVLNPAPAMDIEKDIIEKVDYITPNEHEATLIFKGLTFDEILKKYPEKVIITMGKDGTATYINGKGKIISECRKNCKVVDTTGAGDTFNAAFVYAISNNYDIEKALKFANIAAGLSIEKLGAQTGMPYLKDVLKEIA